MAAAPFPCNDLWRSIFWSFLSVMQNADQTFIICVQRERIHIHETFTQGYLS
jgi:hypothetical protein